MKLKLVLLGLIFTFICGGRVIAEEQVDCQGSCPEGKKLTSYADGNEIKCACYPEAQMEETVPDPNKDPNSEENTNQYD